MITVNYLKSLEEEILDIYNKRPEAKKDDMLLYYEYCYKKFVDFKVLNSSDWGISWEEICHNLTMVFACGDKVRKSFQISPYSAVERCARKIRERENKVDDIKAAMELVFKQYALDKGE